MSAINSFCSKQPRHQQTRGKAWPHRYPFEYAKAHRRALAAAKQQMELTGTPILGCVLNKVAMDRLGARKYYSYGGKYGYGRYGKYGRYGYSRQESTKEKNG